MSHTLQKGFSIIICSFNGKHRLKPTLEHLSLIVVPEGAKAELILVDNASTDGTAAFVKQFWQELGAPFPLRLLEEARAGKGYAVEKGYDAAQYTFTITVDDDNWLDACYLVNACKLLELHPEIGVLQAESIGVFEKEAPKWLDHDNLQHFFVLGWPNEKEGFYPDTNFGAWGAGMVVRTGDWHQLRKLGFQFLTSKVPGKAAGEDHELAIALLLLGRKIYFSRSLHFQHYMPAGRMEWEKLEENFRTFGYVTRFNFLYALVIHAYRNGYTLSDAVVEQHFAKYYAAALSRFTFKQRLYSFMRPQKYLYHLKLLQLYATKTWFKKLSGTIGQDIAYLESWMVPLLRQHKSHFNINSMYMLP